MAQTQSKDTFGTRSQLQIGSNRLTYYSLSALAAQGMLDLERMPFSIRILLEALLRNEDGFQVRQEDIRRLAAYDAKAPAQVEIPFKPARVILQDFTGVPSVVDLAALRSAMHRMGGDPSLINPQVRVDLVIDHSVQVDEYDSPFALSNNAAIEFERNRERYEFLRWGQQAFENFSVVPPASGIVHQVNLEYLGRAVWSQKAEDGLDVAYPDTLVGTDSHTTMINGLGVLGWGVGGIEAEAAMLGQPISMLIPQVVGFKLTGKLPEGATATDLVLTVTQMLRNLGVVGKFVEFFGPGLRDLSLADRATIGNMAPEYGATCGIFPVQQQTLDYLKFTGRSESQLQLTEAYMKAMGLWHDENSAEAKYSDLLTLDLSSVVPSIAEPKRPQDRIALSDSKHAFEKTRQDYNVQRSKIIQTTTEEHFADEGGSSAVGNRDSAKQGEVAVSYQGKNFSLKHGAVVIAAITSCTNTSNPAVLMAAGLVAKKARALGLQNKPWVKTSLAPGSKVVTDYLQKAGLLAELEALGFYLVGYGCTTCIGNSGPLPQEVSEAIHAGDLMVASVLSGNRNFEGRIHAEVRSNYLASPPLVVAYALAGTMDIDLYQEPIGIGSDGTAIYLKDIWPSSAEIQATIRDNLDPSMFASKYADVYSGDEHWNALLEIGRAHV